MTQELETRTIKIGYIARVEGEGSLHIKAKGSEIEELHLKIFEAPRFFEAFLRGRSFEEAPDITARICGICPVAYQMSTVHAIEAAFGMTIPPHLRAIRRLLYCGEWIESHALHIFMLHAPDFLGYPDAISMAKQHKTWVESGLRMKKAGNRILTILGGREIHPINVKVGGFYHLPPKTELLALVEELKWGLEKSYQTLLWVSQFNFPNISIDSEYVALHNPEEYPINEGRIVSNRGLDIAVTDYLQHFEEIHVAHSTALHSVHKGFGSYLTGPLARLRLNIDRLTPTARKAAEEVQMLAHCMNPYRSIQARAVELMFAFEEALDLIQSYDPRQVAAVPVTSRASSGVAATEAPRGILFHRYALDAQGIIQDARIVPPTSQNQKRIEDDLALILAGQLHRPDAEIMSLCEQAIRNYDPCISCATHFLKLSVDRSQGNA